MIHDTELMKFVVESNRIEDIHRQPTAAEMLAHADLLALKRVEVGDVERFVTIVAGATLRTRFGEDVRVGNHIAPPGGPNIPLELKKILQSVNQKHANPYTTHVKYETLHPFMDGNGRSGRALWLKMMIRRPGFTGNLGFLHEWYYQSLDGARKRN